MLNLSGQHYSFIVRIWWEERQLWRGWVLHAGSLEETYVQSLPELLAFIQARTGELCRQPGRQGKTAEGTKGG